MAERFENAWFLEPLGYRLDWGPELEGIGFHWLKQPLSGTGVRATYFPDGDEGLLVIETDGRASVADATMQDVTARLMAERFEHASVWCPTTDRREYAAVAANRATAGADQEPVRRECPARARVGRDNPGLGAQERPLPRGFEAKLHSHLDPPGLRPGSQSRRVQLWRGPPSQQAPGLAEACRDHEAGSLREQHGDGRHVEKRPSGQRPMPLPASRAAAAAPPRASAPTAAPTW